MHDYRKLAVWETAHRLAIEVFLSSSRFRQHEPDALASGLRRGSLLIASNIEDACSEPDRSEQERCLERALQSAEYLESQLLLAGEQGLRPCQDRERHLKAVSEVKQALASHLKNIKAGQECEAGEKTMDCRRCTEQPESAAGGYR